MKITTLILSLFILFKPVLPAVEYVVLYDYIKNELCLNKDKPEMECNGKCHLKKELAKTAESENNNQKQRSSSLEISLLYYQVVLFDLPIDFSPQSILKTLFFYHNIYDFTFSSLIFRPPLYPPTFWG